VITSNNVEYNFTGAISSVTSDIVTKAYFTSNHYEETHVQLNALLTNTGIEVEDISTVGLEAIPADCSLLIIDNPQQDISTTDISLLDSFLESGGNLIVITDYESSSLIFTNLNEVLHKMNLNITNSRVCENDPSYRIQATSGYGFYANVPTGTFSKSSYEKSIIAAYVRGINVFENPKSYISTEPVITTSSDAILEKDGDPSQAGAAGTQNVAMYSVNTGGKVASEAVVIGTTYLTSDAYIEQYSLNDSNVYFFATIVRELVGSSDTVQVQVKQYPNFDLKSKPSASVQSFWSIMLVAILPLAFIVMGVVVYKRRKNR